MTAPTLDAFLNSYVRGEDARHAAIAATVRKLAEAAVKVRHTVSHGALGGVSRRADGRKDAGIRETNVTSPSPDENLETRPAFLTAPPFSRGRCDRYSDNAFTAWPNG